MTRMLEEKDTGDLERLGYKQELLRKLGPFASFASGFSFVSILTTVFQLFIIGFAFGGPAYFWTWPIVFVGQVAVALCFAELAARYPIAGAIYQWSRRVSTDPVGWMAGWLMQLGYIISVAAIAIALQAVLPAVWDGFQILGGDPSPTSPSGALNAIILGSICIAICTAIASFGVTKMALITRIGVSIEIAGVVLVSVLLLLHVHRGPEVVFQTNGVQGTGSYLWPFLASMLMAAYVMYGFDSAAELSEETTDPRRTAPKAIIRCMVISGIGGGVLILVTLMAAPDITAPELSTQGIAWVVTSELGDVVGRVILAVVAISIFSATLAISASATRVMFSMARDGQLPFAKALAKVSPRTQTPILPGVVVGVLSIGVLLINLGQTSVFASVTSVSVVIVYLAYLFVTIPLLWHRIRGNRAHTPEPAHFALGRWGLPVNVVAVVFGLFLLINVGWPRAEVYDPAGQSWVLQYSAPLSVVAAIGLGVAAYRVMRRQRATTALIKPISQTSQVSEARSLASHVLDSPLRYVAAAIAVSSGFAYVLEAEDQFHRAIWFGVLFAAITGGWFIIGSFLALVDTRATWQSLVALSGGSLALWGVGQFVEASEAVDDVGHVSEPLTQVRLAAAVLLIALGLRTLRARRHRLRNSGRAAVVAGIVVFVLGILGTVVAATVQSFSVEGDCGPEQVQAGRSECADS